MKKHLLLNSAGGLLLAVLGCLTPLAVTQAQSGMGSDGSYQGGASDSDMRSTMPSDSGSTSAPSEQNERQPGAMGPIRNDTMERDEPDRTQQRRKQTPGARESDPSDAYREPGSGPNGQAIPGYDTGTKTP